jgi:predicted transcriptional regulator
MRSLGRLELAIMEQAWHAGRPVRVREVLDHLQAGRPLALTTVLTVMERLYRKGWLAREQSGRAHLYRPTVTRAEYAAGLMSQALAEGEDGAETFVRFVALLGPGKLEELRRALEASPSAAPLAVAASF